MLRKRLGETSLGLQEASRFGRSFDIAMFLRCYAS